MIKFNTPSGYINTGLNYWKKSDRGVFTKYIPTLTGSTEGKIQSVISKYI